MKLRGPLPDLLDTRGVIYLKAGDFQHAIADLNEAAAGAPSPAKYFHLAQAYLGAKNKEAATQSWDKARKSGLKEESLHPLEVGTYKEVLSGARGSMSMKFSIAVGPTEISAKLATADRKRAHRGRSVLETGQPLARRRIHSERKKTESLEAIP